MDSTNTFVQLYQSCFCCTFCPGPSWLLSSVVTRIIYFSIFLLYSLAIVIFHFAPFLTRGLPFCDNESFMCHTYSGYIGIYRVGFPLGLFFFVMSLITIKVRSSRSHRAPIQNGLWLYKTAIIIGISVGYFYLPFGVGDRLFMLMASMSLMWFKIVELLIYTQVTEDLTGFAMIYMWSEGSLFTKIIFAFIGTLFFLMGIMIAILLHILYGLCTLNFVFIYVNLSISYVINVCSFAFNWYKRNHAGILKGCVLTTHVMFVTWTAITNNAKDSCNPAKNVSYWMFVVTNYTSSVLLFITISLAVAYYYRVPNLDFPNPLVFVEERGKEFCGVWGKRKIIGTIQPNLLASQPVFVVYRSTNDRDDEYEQVTYVWSAVHSLLSESILTLMLCMTQNYVPIAYTQPVETEFHNNQLMWFKMVSTWISLIVYMVKDFCGVSLF